MGAEAQTRTTRERRIASASGRDGQGCRWSYRGSTIRRMSVSKRSISLEDSVAERVAHAAEEDGVSFSAWLSAAAEQRLRLRDGLRAVEEWEDEAGPLSPEERAAGEALLDKLLGRKRARTA